MINEKHAQIFVVEFKHNNSGGHWWIGAQEGLNLENNGWVVAYVEKTIPKYAYLRIRGYSKNGTLNRAILEWEKLTKTNSEAEGCPCCGFPFNFKIYTKGEFETDFEETIEEFWAKGLHKKAFAKIWVNTENKTKEEDETESETQKEDDLTEEYTKQAILKHALNEQCTHKVKNSFGLEIEALAVTVPRIVDGFEITTVICALCKKPFGITVKKAKE